MMFLPQKGKAFDKLPGKALSLFHGTKYLVSTKYDGNQIFITKINGKVRMFTSDWKEFFIKVIADDLASVHGNFTIIGEFMHGCIGKLGDRVKSAKLTTYRTNFIKRLPNIASEEKLSTIKVFDFLEIDVRVYSDHETNQVVTNINYVDRLSKAKVVLNGMPRLNVIVTELMTGSEAQVYAKALVKDGWEGCMLVEPYTNYHLGKRVNHSIKLKYRKTADLRCVGIEEGKGKYEGMIGALILEDSIGRKVSVGSGLDDSLRGCREIMFLGNVIEIEYEQILDTYIQPVFIAIREEKEID